MNRATILALTVTILIGLGAASSAIAADSPDPFEFVSPDSPGFDEYQVLIDRLDADGARLLLIEKTFLGRVRIVSVANDMVREVIISPNTGEIRRDIILGAYNPNDYPNQTNGNGNGKGKGKGSENGQGSDRSGDKGGNGRGK